MRHSGHSDKQARYSPCSHRTFSLGAGGTYPHFFKEDKEFFIKIEHKNKQLDISTGLFRKIKSRAKERDYSGGGEMATSYMLHKENHCVQATFSGVLNDVSSLAQQISGGEVFQTGNSKYKALRWKQAGHVPGTAMRSAMLELKKANRRVVGDKVKGTWII